MSVLRMQTTPARAFHNGKKISLDPYNTTFPTRSTTSKITLNNSQKIGSISGMAFEDQNANGFKEAEEPGLSGWTIILKREGIELSKTITDKGGHYSFEVPKPGRYIVEEKLLLGWNQTYPIEGSYNITFTEGQGLDYDFGNSHGPFKDQQLASSTEQTHPLISRDDWINTVQKLEAVPNVAPSSKIETSTSFPAYFSLLSQVPSYSARNQGGCGNC